MLRINLNLDIDEGKLHFNNRFLKKLPEGELKKIIESFFESIEETREYRNSFAHRFPPNYPAYRVVTGIKNGRITLSSGNGNFAKPSVILENIEDSLSALAYFIKRLQIIVFSK